MNRDRPAAATSPLWLTGGAPPGYRPRPGGPQPPSAAQRQRIARRGEGERASAAQAQRRARAAAAEIVQGLRAGHSIVEIHHKLIRPIISPDFGEQEARALRDSLRELHDAGLLAPLLAERAALDTLAAAERLLADAAGKRAAPASRPRNERSRALIASARDALAPGPQQ